MIIVGIVAGAVVLAPHAAAYPLGYTDTPEPPEPPAANVAPPEPEPIPEPWASLAQCESHGEWDYNEHSGWGSGLYDGGLQFDPGTWVAYGGQDFAPTADQATPHQQVLIAERVLADAGWGAWPACSLELGLR